MSARYLTGPASIWLMPPGSIVFLVVIRLGTVPDLFSTRKRKTLDSFLTLRRSTLFLFRLTRFSESSLEVIVLLKICTIPGDFMAAFVCKLAEVTPKMDIN